MNGQSAAKLPVKEEGSTTISRKESTILKELEKVNATVYKLSDRLPDVKGIYGIYNAKSDKVYIGSAINIHKRKVRHLWYLNHNCHHSLKLQNSYNLNKDSFCLYIIDLTDDLSSAEYYWLQKLDSYKNGYNSTDKIYDYFGFKLSRESIDKAIRKSSKPVLALDKFNVIKHEFKSVSDAAKFVKTSSCNVSHSCQGKFVFIKGYKFVYKTDYKPGINYAYKPKRIMLKEEKKMRSKLLLGKKQSKEHRYNLAVVQGHAVSKIDPGTKKVIQQYISINEAERENGIKPNTLWSAMKYQTLRDGYVYKRSKDIV